MKSLIDTEAGTFYAIGQGHMILEHDQKPGEYEAGTKIELNSMFDMYVLNRDDKPVGYYFVSAFKTENKGGYIITYMESKRGRATVHRLLIRLPEFMVYDFPACGALVVSTKVSDKVKSIFMEQ